MTDRATQRENRIKNKNFRADIEDDNYHVDVFYNPREPEIVDYLQKVYGILELKAPSRRELEEASIPATSKRGLETAVATFSALSQNEAISLANNAFNALRKYHIRTLIDNYPKED